MRRIALILFLAVAGCHRPSPPPEIIITNREAAGAPVKVAEAKSPAAQTTPAPVAPTPAPVPTPAPAPASLATPVPAATPVATPKPSPFPAPLPAPGPAFLVTAKQSSGPHVDRWNAAKVNPRDLMRVDKAVALYRRNASRYEKIEAMRPNGVPAPVVFCLHMRESDNNFARHAHEGSLLLHRTVDDPKGRLPHPADPPYTFEQSAEDAYYVCDRLQLADWRDMQSALSKMESFNGFGYRARGIAPPYLYAGTNIYTGGKFVRDHVFDSRAQDAQLGCVAVLKRMDALGIRIPFVPQNR